MISVAELSTWLGADAVTQHLLLAELVEQGVAYIQTRTGRYFGPPVQVEENHIGGRRSIRLREQPVAGEVVVVEHWTGAAWEVVPDTDYSVVSLGARDGGRLRHNSAWPWGDIRVTYTAGYGPGAEPADVRAYLYAWITRRWGTVGGATGGNGRIVSESIGGYTYRLADGNSDADMDQLVKLWSPRTFGVA